MSIIFGTKIPGNCDYMIGYATFWGGLIVGLSNLLCGCDVGERERVENRSVSRHRAEEDAEGSWM